MIKCRNPLPQAERPHRAAAAVRQRRAPKSFASIVRCGFQQPRQELQDEQGNDLMVITLKVAMLAAAANAMAACYPQAAKAGSWQPRRHAQRRLARKYQTKETPAQVRSHV